MARSNAGSSGVDPYDPALTPLVTNLGRRFLARLVDTVVMILVATAALSPFSETDAAGDRVLRPPVGVVALVIVAVLLYEVLMVAWRGQTLGKIVAKVRVVSVTPPDKTPSLVEAGRRVLVPGMVGLLAIPIPALLPLAVALVYLSAALRPDGRGVPDRVGRTRVIALPR
jgi:uncharacterized RDD family membrane protein YckC